MPYCNIHGSHNEEVYGCPDCKREEDDARDARSEIRDQLDELQADNKRAAYSNMNPGEHACPYCMLISLKRGARRCPKCQHDIEPGHWAELDARDQRAREAAQQAEDRRKAAVEQLKEAERQAAAAKKMVFDKWNNKIREETAAYRRTPRGQQETLLEREIQRHTGRNSLISSFLLAFLGTAVLLLSANHLTYGALASLARHTPTLILLPGGIVWVLFFGYRMYRGFRNLYPLGDEFSNYFKWQVSVTVALCITAIAAFLIDPVTHAGLSGLVDPWGHRIIAHVVGALCVAVLTVAGFTIFPDRLKRFRKNR